MSEPISFEYEGRQFLGIDREGAIARGVPGEAFDSIRAEKKWQAVRAKRDQLLTACDWTQLADCPLTDAQKAEWQTYRQALRDIPQDAGDPDAVVWPTEPTVA